MSTKDYRSKRDFDRTAEPPGSSSQKTAKQPQFVIQKHDASILHYDFRIEVDGTRRNPVSTQPDSVKSGRTIERVADEEGGDNE